MSFYANRATQPPGFLLAWLQLSCIFYHRFTVCFLQSWLFLMSFLTWNLFYLLLHGLLVLSVLWCLAFTCSPHCSLIRLQSNIAQGSINPPPGETFKVTNQINVRLQISERSLKLCFILSHSRGSRRNERSDWAIQEKWLKCQGTEREFGLKGNLRKPWAKLRASVAKDRRSPKLAWGLLQKAVQVNERAMPAGELWGEQWRGIWS